MAVLKVKVEKIHEIIEHQNADRMEIAVIGGEGGYQTCIQKGSFKAGDKCIYFPVDSVLPRFVEDTIFGKDSKVKLSKSRVRTIRLRGAISQGIAVPVSLFMPSIIPPRKGEIGSEVTGYLGVTKYEPSSSNAPIGNTRVVSSKNQNPFFLKYTNIQHLKSHPTALIGETVVAFEKIHGTNFRAGWVPSYPKNWWDRVKKALGFFPEWEFVYGSHNVQLQGKYKDADFYSKKISVDVYTKMVKQYDLPNRLKYGEVIYGEIYGGGIQKGYSYGCDSDEQKLVVVDLKVHGKYVSSKHLLTWCFLRKLGTPPWLYYGPFSMKEMDLRITGPSKLPGQPIREGLVVRTEKEKHSHIGRMIFKYINPDYLLMKDNTEYH